MSRVDGTVNRYVRSVLNGYHELWFVLNLTLHDRMCEQGIKLKAKNRYEKVC